MRLDKYLKVSRLIKRRSVAKEACEKDRVLINNKIAKPGTEVKVGDQIEIKFGDKSVKAEITSVVEHVRKEAAKDMFKIL
ncbi:RNA-binding S4 domain-containing protein [Serpentinicella sp. ANB-PHB4]|uniref:RNA-binding S4 domain-containing protein n=1 Tax=Serpentinicella sp. ANB-PHB4 TaxID=3074076 RepID=UPI00285A5E97|nr:RNA-binding S4 domain-containing protein [Serpentinicella sp. ANB-PHB4]MDR5659181.1 RNA-binding S4 domain-containing protein [Serpentinicella sp. ANB-PHB4]